MRKCLLMIVPLFMAFCGAFAQGRCWDCNVDSLKQQLSLKTTDRERIQLLQLLIDFDPLGTSQGPDVLSRYNELFELNNKLQLIDTTPYVKLREAKLLDEKKDYVNALDLFNQALTLFDKQKKLMYWLLWQPRYFYTKMGSLEDNEEKIAHHSRRADNIVKGMLLHARASGGKREPTDVNKLVDEYLRLSYQGIRAKDTAFTSLVETHFDSNIGKTPVVPQEIGRVLLNLYNNAFYAVHQKKAQENGSYEPVVSVSTKREGNNISIIVKDNGTGMPQKVAEKVFQPFFTTKPTGEGTGLGLSLSYDIITKGHGGEMKVETREGEGAAFIIQLPVSN